MLKKVLYGCVGVAIVFAFIAPASADHDVSGAVINDGEQSLSCLSICTNSGGCNTITQRFFARNGQEVASKTHNNVPAYSIRSLAYTGSRSPVACEDDENDGVSINIVDIPGRRVVAAQGNHNDSGEVAVINKSKQYPICTGFCDKESPNTCSFRLRFYDSTGDVVADKQFNNVPAHGNRNLVYGGGKSPVWCRKTVNNGNVDSNILLVDKATGKVDVTVPNDD